MGTAEADPLWQLPLWSGYDDELSSKVADLNNVSSSGFSGAIIGALFLRRFVGEATHWLHIDLYGWNPASVLDGPSAQRPRAFARSTPTCKHGIRA